MKIMKLIFILLLLGITFFFGSLYYVLRTRTKIVSHELPYSSILHKDLILDRDVVLVKNRTPDSFEKINLIVEMDQNLSEEITEKQILKKGTALRMEKASLFKNGTSGFTTSMVMGRIFTDAGAIEFEYAWGKKSFSLDAAVREHWTFEKPIWEDENGYEEKYFLPEL